MSLDLKAERLSETVASCAPRPLGTCDGGAGAGRTNSRDELVPVEPCPVDPCLELEVSALGTPNSAVASLSDAIVLVSDRAVAEYG